MVHRAASNACSIAPHHSVNNRPCPRPSQKPSPSLQNRVIYRSISMKSDSSVPSIQKQYESRVGRRNMNPEEHARNLIFGARKYQDFSLEEKEIVNSYQKKMLEVDGGIILPNTQEELEQEQANNLYSRWLSAHKKR